jgi:hypothetical protein
MAFGLVLLLGVAGLAGADRGPDEVIARLRERILDEAARIPNYTCVQTIDRKFYGAASPRPPSSCAALSAERKIAGYRIALYGSDRFRLDVGVGKAREVYSWAGAERFEDRDLNDLVPGPASTGSFASLLHMMFGGDVAEFLYHGAQTLDRRRLLAYSFRVPASQSNYFLRNARAALKAMAYHGTILVDPETGDLMRLDVQIDDAEPASNLCEFDASLDYARMRIGAGEFLLPKTTRQTFVMPTRWEAESTVAFSACREYRADSIVSYEDSASAQPAGGKDAAAREPLKLPPGLRVSVELTAAIDSATAAAGDAYAGRLAEPLLDESKNTLAPRGAIVRGRIMSVQSYRYPSSVQIALALESVEIRGAALPFRVAPKKAGSGGGAETIRHPQGELPRSSESDCVLIELSGDHRVIRPGYKAEWVTAAP